MTTIDEVIKDLEEGCDDDIVGLWAIIWHLRQAIDEQEDIFEATLRVVSTLLDKGIVAGQFRNDRFEIWRMPKAEVLGKIRNDWRTLGREPNLGDVVWLTTEKLLSRQKPSAGGR
jgi:hypothetical protein